MQLIPAVDVLDGEVVRLRRGDFEQVTVFGSDPVAMAQAWSDRGAELVHVVDLNGARYGQPDRRLRRRLGESGIPFQIGGGLRTVESAVQALGDGAQRIVLGTAAVWTPDVIGTLIKEVGPLRIVPGLDVRDGIVPGSGWQDEGRPAGDLVVELIECGVEWVLATGISRDGMLTGPDLDLMDWLAGVAPSLRVIASGGVGTLDHLVSLAERGTEAVVVGRALYEGCFSLEEALQAVAFPDKGGQSED